jgi:hypothetical protein
VKIASYIITYRQNDSPDRRENLLALTHWLAQLPDIETIIVEQDTVPTLDAAVVPSTDQLIFAFNPGPFNRSWGLNIGARYATTEILALADADLLAPAGLYPAIERCHQYDVSKPYQRIIDLTVDETAHVRAGNWNFIPTRPDNSPVGRNANQEHINFAGGIFLICRDYFWKIAGFDERFLGWGGEDDAVTIKLRLFKARPGKLTSPPALHLFHPRCHESTFGQPHYQANLQLTTDYRRYTAPDLIQLCDESRPTIGDFNKYRPRC